MQGRSHQDRFPREIQTPARVGPESENGQMGQRTKPGQRIQKAIEGKQRLLILTHNNPDPDAIASAWGLSALAKNLQSVKVELAYGGFLGRAENRAMVEILQI